MTTFNDATICHTPTITAARTTRAISSINSTITAENQQAWRAQLLAGVDSIKVVGTPGRVAVFDPPGAAEGKGTFAVTRDASFNTAIGAAVFGLGRIIAFPHDGYVSFGNNATVGQTEKLYLNCVSWTTESTSKTIKIVTNNDSAHSWLSAQGYSNVVLRQDWENELSDTALVIVELGRFVSQLQRDRLANSVLGGSGLITGGTGWGYEQLGSDLKTMDGNVFLRKAGLGFPGGFSDINPVLSGVEFSNASDALHFVDEVFSGLDEGTDDEKKAAGVAIATVLDILPADHELALQISSIYSAHAKIISATPQTPVSDPLDQSVLVWEAQQLLSAETIDVVAHPTAEKLYGPIPTSANRSKREVLLNTDRSRWVSTGMYAIPGKVVSIQFPARLVGRGYSVRLGGHVDDISQRDNWKRIPRGVSRNFPISTDKLDVASAFGGAIYVDFGWNPPNLGLVPVTMEGAIKAPYFILGSTSDSEWNQSIRHFPAPYAELECELVIISAPSSWIRTLNNPTELMTFWNEAVREQDWVASHENLRTSPERINHDVQISVGLLHAGYPTQGPTHYNLVQVNGNRQATIVTLSELRKNGDWGWFHELGHQMQSRPDNSGNFYTFDGDVEVTVNIFANAAQELLVQAPPNDGWGFANYPDQVMNKAVKETNTSSSFDQKDPYPFYFQLADGMNSWKSYRDVMTIYTDNHATDQATRLTNQQRKDLWLERWSNATGYDMVEYMVNYWKLEVSQSAIQKVKSLNLPSWMPLASSLSSVTVRSGAKTVLNLEEAGRSLDGTAAIVDISSPSHGSLIENSDKSYTYQSEVGFDGEDSFMVTYRSSAGNEQTFTTKVTVEGGGAWAAWTMDEGSGNTLHDMGIAGASGKINGADWVAGHHGSALRFDGASTKVNCGTTPSLSGIIDFTIVAWVRSTRGGLIIQQRDKDGYNGEYVLLVTSDGYMRFFVYNNGFQFNILSNDRVNDGHWHKVVAQREGEVGRIFVDDIPSSSSNGPVKSMVPELSVSIGWDSRDNNLFFNGDISDVRVYAKALPVPFLSTSGLSSYWKMDEGKGSTLYNHGFSGGVSTISGLIDWVEGAPKYALQFDGVKNYVSLGHGASLNGQLDFTIHTWIKTRSSGMIIQQRDKKGFNGEYMLRVQPNGQVNFAVYNNGFQFILESKGLVNDGEWHKIVAQREGREGRVFVDGELSASGSGPVKALRKELSVTIGCDIRDDTFFFTGIIDDVRIYKYADDPRFSETDY